MSYDDFGYKYQQPGVGQHDRTDVYQLFGILFFWLMPEVQVKTQKYDIMIIIYNTYSQKYKLSSKSMNDIHELL